MIESLLYVSFSTLFMPDDEDAVDDIVRCARARNARLHLTGSLIFTHQRFAQYIEGPEVALADVMASIRRDPRHRDIEIVATSRADRRRFPDWDMAYAGPSAFVGKRVDALVGASPGAFTSLPAELLVRLMAELSRDADLGSSSKVA